MRESYTGGSFTSIFAVPKGKKKRVGIATTNEPTAGSLSSMIEQKYRKKGYKKFKFISGRF